jgi:hypothetical protein
LLSRFISALDRALGAGLELSKWLVVPLVAVFLFPALVHIGGSTGL